MDAQVDALAPAIDAVPTRRRGVVLSSAFARPPGAAPSAAAADRRWRFWLLFVTLPLFAQSFQYLVDIPPLYALSKIWPLLLLPLAGWAATRLDLSYRAILLVVCGWTMGIAPLVGVFELGDDIVGAVSSTAKVWSLTTGFSMAAALLLLRADSRRATRAVMILGATTFVVMLLLWLVAPISAYDQGANQTKLFLYDQERGYRVYMPMFFGTLAMFTLNRSFWMRPRLWKALALAAALLLLNLIYKQRTVIAVTIVVMVIAAALSADRRWRTPILTGLAVLAVLATPIVFTFLRSPSIGRTLGGSLSTRQVEIVHALDFLNAEPHRWIFGAGSTTRVGELSLADIVGAKAFFLADLGWLGVVFEYGAIGAALLALLHVAGLQVTWRGARRADPLARALFDYVLYIVLASPILSVVFAPGELVTCMALAWCLNCEAARRLAPPSPPSPPSGARVGGRLTSVYG